MVGNKVIAVDLGGTNLRTAIVTNGKIIDYTRVPTPKTGKALIKAIFDSVSGLMGKGVKAICVGSPGPLLNGVIKNPPNLPLRNFDLKDYLKKKFKVRVEVENDAKCVALSEMYYGVRKKNFIILTFGTGIGGGIIINGKLYKGGGFAGEMGHIILNNGKDFESMWKMHKKESIKHFGKVLLIKELLEMKDKRAKKILDDVTLYLGEGIGSMINVFDPEVVVLMGGARESGNVFLNMIRKKAWKYSVLPKKTPIEWSKIEHPGLLGASLLVR
ncbi:MAG: ROK family protein [Nanoarchaeota archaeon]